MSADSPTFIVTVSGSDASGLAGMQADNRAIHTMGAFPLNVISALTLQTDRGVQSVDLTSAELVRMHLLGLLNDYPVTVIKAGMLGNAAIVRVVAETIKQYPGVRLVLDPILNASSGRPLLDMDGMKVLLKELLPQTYLLTPNIPELACLVGEEKVESVEAEALACGTLLAQGCSAVLVKGGHRPGISAMDRLYSADGPREFVSKRVETANTRGSGCSLASLIAAGLALGLDLEESIQSSKEKLGQSLAANSTKTWPGNGPALL